MPTLESVGVWIQANILDSKAWDNSNKQGLAITQATRNLERWYPEMELTDEVVSYQAIWEIQGTDPALKFQNQGVKSVSEGSDRIDYHTRDKVAPEVREILGVPSYELTEVFLEGGSLL
jgi:N-acetyl-anhydromuramyl-L-alanine amidase AmpD